MKEDWETSLEDEIKYIVSTSKYVTAKDWNMIEAKMNQLHDKFVERIRCVYPMLTEDDIHIILLMVIGLTNKQISKLCGILPASFRKRRYRLKKKMDVECDSLSEFLRNLYTK